MRLPHSLCAISLLVSVATLAQAQGPAIGPTCPVFPADHIWNTAIDTLPVHPSSSTWVTTIGPTKPLHPDFGSGLYNNAIIGIPFVTVPGTQTKYTATFTYQSESDPGPYAIPLNAPIEGGGTGDAHVISVDIDSCILYEIYAAVPGSSSWSGGSGAIFDLLGYTLRTASWTSADAAGLPIFPGLLRYDEIAAGHINHAIRFTVPQTQAAYVWPARHYASSLTGSQYPPMGARFRLKANFNISTFSATNQIILTAMKKYGMFLADNGSAWYISGAPDSRWDNNDLHALTTILGSNFEAVDDTTLMIDPNSGQALQNGVAVTVTPSSANVVVNGTQPFGAVVNNSGGSQTVTWDVNGVVPGTSATGTINSAGVYTAPATVPSPPTVTVHATSVATATAVGSATVTIIGGVTVAVSPISASVRVSKTRQFTATVKNTTNMSVTWKVVGGSANGTISSSGLYKAPAKVPSPATITISATSAADPTKSATAQVTISK